MVGLRGEYPQLPVVGVGALVLRDGKVLLGRRASPPSAGMWAIPGGKVELGEGVLEAAARELEEETGLACRPLGVVNVDNLIVKDPSGKIRFHYVLITVLMGDCSGEPAPSSDVLEIGFFDVAEASERPDVAPSTRGFLKKLASGLVPISSPIPVLTTVEAS